MTGMFSLKGRRAMVIGSSRGIGLAIARALSEAGAELYLNGRDAALLEVRVRELDAAWGGSAVAVPFDARDRSAAAAAIAAAASLDIIVVNASAISHGPTLETSPDDWAAVIEGGLSTPFFLAQAALRQMVPRGSGRVILLSSVFDRLARGKVAAYVTAKGGVSALVRVLAVEFGGTGVTVNGIAPGFVRTDATRHLYENPEFNAMIAARTPAGRWGEPEDIGGAAVFLASDAAAYVNGCILTVDGGLTGSL